MSKRTKTTPRFASEAEERAFWEGQDSTAHVDWSTAKRAVLPNLKATAETIPNARLVSVTENTLTVHLEDGRTLSVPLGWYPRLANATLEERQHWRLIGRGSGIHWDDIDEDISIEGLLLGKRSGESQGSFERWLATRRR